MSGQLIGALILWLIVAIIAIAIVVYLVNWLYRRSSKEAAFVRTGLLGEKVVIDGGAFVLPIIHDITPVNMNVLQMRVHPRPGRRHHHPRPDAGRHRCRLLCARSRHHRGGVARGLDARPAHHAAGDAARAAVRQVRLGDPLGRLRDDDGGHARAARGLSRQGQGGRRRGARPERARTGIGGADQSRPDRSAVFQRLEPLRRRRPDPSDRADRGPAQDAQRHRAGFDDQDPLAQSRGGEAVARDRARERSWRGWSSSATSRSAAPCSAPKSPASARCATPRPSRPRSMRARKSRNRGSATSAPSARRGSPPSATFASARSNAARSSTRPRSPRARRWRRRGSPMTS